jgi:hypothetical protein
MITFVSAFLKLNNNVFEWYKSLNDCFNLFEKLFKVKDIKINLFLSPCYKEYGDILISKYPYNLKIDYLDLDNLWTYNEVCKIKDLQLPNFRNLNKDSVKYLSLQNCKLELIDKSIQNNYFNTIHYAWIDFRIFHIIKEDVENIFVNDLEKMVNTKLKENLFVIPGCWDKITHHTIFKFLMERISWRFCGGFFLGDKESLTKFYTDFKKIWLLYLSLQKITWEVNIWHLLEINNIINPLWFKADHNNTIVKIPEECYQI